MQVALGVVVLGFVLAVLGPREGMAAQLPPLPFKVIVNQVGDLDGFGFGLGVCPIGCVLPGPPAAQEPDDPPFTDRSLDDPTCVSTVTWTHDFRDQLPPGAEVMGVVFALNVAGIEPGKFASKVFFDTVLPAPLTLDQGALGSGLFIPPPSVLFSLIPLVSDGILNVKVVKGGRTGCDDLYFDASLLIVLVRVP